MFRCHYCNEMGFSLISVPDLNSCCFACLIKLEHGIKTNLEMKQVEREWEEERQSLIPKHSE